MLCKNMMKVRVPPLGVKTFQQTDNNSHAWCELPRLHTHVKGPCRKVDSAQVSTTTRMRNGNNKKWILCESLKVWLKTYMLWKHNPYIPAFLDVPMLALRNNSDLSPCCTWCKSSMFDSLEDTRRKCAQQDVSKNPGENVPEFSSYGIYRILLSRSFLSCILCTCLAASKLSSTGLPWNRLLVWATCKDQRIAVCRGNPRRHGASDDFPSVCSGNLPQLSTGDNSCIRKVFQLASSSPSKACTPGACLRSRAATGLQQNRSWKPRIDTPGNENVVWTCLQWLSNPLVLHATF